MKEMVSIIIPTYNRAKTIERAIRSIFRQTYVWYEIIIVDDGSTDNTKEVVEGIEDDRIRYIRLEHNQGAAHARNEGIRASKYDYIAFLDSDDEWMSDKLELQMAKMMESSETVGMVYCRMQMGLHKEMICPTYDWPDGVSLEGNLFPLLLWRNMIGTPAMLVKRRCLEAAGGFMEELRSIEDWELSLRIARDWDIGFVDEILVDVNASENSISSDMAAFFRARCYIVSKYRRELVQLGLLSTVEKEILENAESHGMKEEVQELLGRKNGRKVLFVNGGAMRTASAPIIMTELSRLGYEMEEYEQLLELTELDDDKIGDLADYIRAHHVDVIMSLYFIMDAALAAYQTNVQYAAILWDAPYVLAYNVLAKLDNVWFSTFDKLDRERLLQYGCQHVLYQPLSVAKEDVIQWNRDIQNTLEGHYFHDISFVGRLYEDNGYDAVVKRIPANMQDYFTSIFEEAAFKWDGVNRIYGRTGQEILEYIKLVSPDFRITDTKQDIEEVRYFEVQYLIRKIANIERITILDFLAENHTVDLYTFNEEAAKGLLHNVNVRPAAFYGKAAALVYAGSKINLHIALKGIEGGTSQRVMDICAAGGFVLSSYCAETAELFEEDKEIVMFKTPEELVEKIDYYLSHEEERRQIAKAGYEKVMRCYTYERKLEELLKWVESGQNVDSTGE